MNIRSRATDEYSFPVLRLWTALCKSAMIILAGIAVGSLVGTLSPLLTGMVFAGALALLLSILRPDLALYLFFCGVVLLTDAAPFSVDFFALPDIDVGQGLPSAMTLFLLLILGCVLARNLLIEHHPLPVSLRPLAVYFIILLSSLAFSLIYGHNQRQVLIRVDFIHMLMPVVCFYLCITILNTRTRIYRLLAILMVVAFIKAIILAAFFLAGQGWPYASFRIVTLDSADLLVFITLGFVVLHLLLRGDFRGSRALLVAMACIPFLFALIFSYRRAQWGGSLLSMGLLFLGTSYVIRRRIIFISLLSLIVSICVVALVFSFNQEAVTRISSRFNTIFDPTHPSNLHHALEARQVLIDLSKSPFFGLGLGSQHSGIAGNEYSTVPTNIVHNTFLYVWMKLGLPGLMFYLWAATRYVRKILQFRKTEVHDNGWGLVLPLAASTGLWFAMFLTSLIPWYTHQSCFKALVAAIVISLIHLADRKAQVEPESLP